MRAIIPVAGVGSRLRPHTYTVPKVLLNVAGKPIIAHIMDQVIKTRIDHVVFIVGHLGEMFETWARRTYPQLKLDFVEQPQTLGLGHAVGLGLKVSDSEVMSILGDTIFEVDLGKILQSPSSALGIKEVEDARRFGVVELKDGWISNLVEKSQNPPSHSAIVGLFSRYGVGVDSIDLKAATDFGIIVANVPHYCMDEVSQSNHRDDSDVDQKDRLFRSKGKVRTIGFPPGNPHQSNKGLRRWASWVVERSVLRWPKKSLPLVFE